MKAITHSKINKHSHSTKRLNIGCGDRPTEGWYNYDNSISVLLCRVPLLPEILRKVGLVSAAQYRFMHIARTGMVVYADVVKRIPQPDSSVDLIYSCHMLEHLTRSEALQFMKECRRVLSPGGAIRIVVPDLRRLIDSYLVNSDADSFIDSLYVMDTEQESFSSKLKCLFVGKRLHLWMYDSQSLCQLMVSSGFSHPTVLPAGQTTIDGLINVDLTERSEESLYVEARNS